ncbi:hypothetical protein DM860_002200 [Cuscuta australis]|uniref:Endonuclease/exonuclease/phosphatase domain-containing protein n=1 Tax=Cuscuta australis TaxID=267555 RepID=A0A328DZY2_9ASTE|nr:hypothetical protein DM860_002200 [Cuscuta australis]
MEQVKNQVGFEEMSVVDAAGFSRGLAMLWKKEGMCSILSTHRHFIDIRVTLPGITPGMGTESWLRLFDKVEVLHIEIVSSDHSALFLTLRSMTISYAPKPFRFENAWLKEIDVKEAVTMEWEIGMGCPISDRILRCGEYLQQWGRQKHAVFRDKLRKILLSAIPI